MNQITERILDYAKSKGVSDQEICRIVGAKKDKVNNWKIGQSNPTAEEVAVLAQKFNVTTDYLLVLTDNPNSVLQSSPPENIQEIEEVLMWVKNKIVGEFTQFTSHPETNYVIDEMIDRTTSFINDAILTNPKCYVLNNSMRKILEGYNELNDEGQEEIIKYMGYIKTKDEYIKSDSDGLVEKQA